MNRNLYRTKIEGRVGFAIGIILITSLMAQPVYSGNPGAEVKAKERHDLATSDFIYTQVELQALYFQNIQIISLLKDIRGLLKINLETKKEGDE